MCGLKCWIVSFFLLFFAPSPIGNFQKKRGKTTTDNMGQCNEMKCFFLCWGGRFIFQVSFAKHPTLHPYCPQSFNHFNQYLCILYKFIKLLCRNFSHVSPDLSNILLHAHSWPSNGKSTFARALLNLTTCSLQSWISA